MTKLTPKEIAQEYERNWRAAWDARHGRPVTIAEAMYPSAKLIPDHKRSFVSPLGGVAQPAKGVK